MTEAERLLRRYYDEVWVDGGVDALEDLLARGYRDHDPPPGGRSGDERAARGRGCDRVAAIEFARAFLAGIREPELTVLAVVATDAAAAAHWRLECSIDGRRLTLRGSDLVFIADGRITDIFHVERPLT